MGKSLARPSTIELLKHQLKLGHRMWAVVLHLSDRSTELGSICRLEFCATTTAASADVTKANEKRECMASDVEISYPVLILCLSDARRIEYDDGIGEVGLGMESGRLDEHDDNRTRWLGTVM
jgi:hypothetical protein